MTTYTVDVILKAVRGLEVALHGNASLEEVREAALDKIDRMDVSFKPEVTIVDNNNSVLKQYQPEITIVLSTAHIEEKELRRIQSGDDTYPFACFGDEYSGTIVMPGNIETFIDNWPDSNVPKYLKRILFDAHQLNAQYVKFDQDGLPHPELETFDW